MAQREYHIVVLGSGGVGKSCLTAQFVQNVWIESYNPIIEDSYRKTIDVDGRHVILEILESSGTEQFTAMMKTAQGFLLVFSLTSLLSLHKLTELREQIRNIKKDDSVPLVLVGNKSDLEGQSVFRPLVFQDWGNTPYYETSARWRANVDEVFVDLCRQIIQKDEGRDRDQTAHAWTSAGGQISRVAKMGMTFLLYSYQVSSFSLRNPIVCAIFPCLFGVSPKGVSCLPSLGRCPVWRAESCYLMLSPRSVLPLVIYQVDSNLVYVQTGEH